jgi:hypothetical protein
MRILQELITGRQPYTGTFGLQSSRGGRGDETADLITNLIGANALSEDEIRKVFTIVHIAFARPDNIAPGAKDPARTLQLLRHLTDFTDQSSLRREIAETMEYVQRWDEKAGPHDRRFVDSFNQIDALDGAKRSR